MKTVVFKTTSKTDPSKFRLDLLEVELVDYNSDRDRYTIKTETGRIIENVHSSYIKDV